MREILKSNLLNSINTVAPFKISKRIKKCEKYPCIDMELLDIKQKRDWYYKLSRKNKNLESSDYIMFIEFKKLFKKVNDEKLISYFKDKTLKDFKCTKKFYQFYSSVYTVKSDKSSLTIPLTISDGKLTKSNPKEISNFFNKYFTNINSELKCSLNNFDAFYSYNFPKFIKTEILNSGQFSFKDVSVNIVSNLLNKLVTVLLEYLLKLLKR